MLEFLDNYENRAELRYPCITIDWVTDFEIQYIRDKFSNYSNSLDELSKLNKGDYEDDLSSDLYDENDFDVESSYEGTESDLWSIDDFNNSEEVEVGDPFENVFGEIEEFSTEEDPFTDVFGSNNERSEEDITLNELLEISENIDEEDTGKKKEKVDVFVDKLPVFVNDEKIAEVNLNKETLKVLNHFFKRKWLLEYSEEEKVDISEEFLIKNILRL